MDSKNIRTRQEFNTQLTNPKGKEYIIGLDIGYSGTKVFYETGYFVFPTYAKKLKSLPEIADSNDILYQEAGSKDIYIVGYNAQNMIDDTDTNDSMAELYSRKRYKDKRFKIICNVALALATKNKNDNRDIYIQTGLPSSYVDGDKSALTDVLTKPASFKLRMGTDKNWKEYNISVKRENIDVIPQPAGSFYSILMKNDGKYVDNAREMMLDNIIIMDIGFGTFDFYGLKNRAISCKESSDEYGMKQLLQNVSKKILDDTKEDIRVPAMQKNLQSGQFDFINEDEMKADVRSINPYIEQANNEIFTEAMEKAKSVTNAFRGYRYLVVTGGTGQMWFEDIKKWLEGMKTLKVMGGNINDRLPFMFSNVRGYYLYRYSLNKGR